MFRLVASRYQRASMIDSSNKPFSAWGEIFGDEVVAAAMIDRLIHHAGILSLKGDSYRRRSSGGDGRHDLCQSDQAADRGVKSQPAAGPRTNRTGRTHRPDSQRP